MHVLLVGGGGREHALAWKLARSPGVRELFIAPGNAGTAQLGTNLPIRATDIPAVGEVCGRLGIDLVVVGPEAPLAAGIADHLEGMGIKVFGPSRAAAQVEASKVFARRLMEKYHIPCPRGVVFEDYSRARSYVEPHPLPLVVKADGLAGGKGVTVARTREEALQALHQAMVARAFGEAGERVVVEEYLTGREVSLLAFTDSRTVVPMVPACDYKPVFDGDRGPNTGGMGGYSPPGFLTPGLMEEVENTILRPAVEALAREGKPYKGVLYAGLMLTGEGLKVLEFNCRFGDPETQVMLPRLETDLLEIMLAVVAGELDRVRIGWSTRACVGVVMASGGYPGEYRTGYPIAGLDRLPPGALGFHAGTRAKDGQVITDGGRVLTVVGLGESVPRARKRAYEGVGLIHFEGCYYRRDIALAEELGPQEASRLLGVSRDDSEEVV
jgi:phosphoribosylamine--glycine ligase